MRSRTCRHNQPLGKVHAACMLHCVDDQQPLCLMWGQAVAGDRERSSQYDPAQPRLSLQPGCSCQHQAAVQACQGGRSAPHHQEELCRRSKAS